MGCFSYQECACKCIFFVSKAISRLTIKSIMPPGTPHIVFTPKRALCTGNTSYCRSTMANSIFTIFHTFAASSLTNTTVATEYTLLLRIVVFWKEQLVDKENRYFASLKDLGKTSLGHIPNLNNFPDVLNLLTLLNFADMAWVLTPSRYVDRRQKIPPHYLTAKAAADSIRDWLYAKFKVEVTHGGDEWEHIDLKSRSLEYLVHQCRVLVRHLIVNGLHGIYPENISLDPQVLQYTSREMVESSIEEDICSEDQIFSRLWMQRKAKEVYNLRKLANAATELHNMDMNDGKYKKLKQEVKDLEWADTGNSYDWPESLKYRCSVSG